MNEKIFKYVIVGTAGHVDHGKTQLIKALTGIDTDRHPEEKQRGMSIDLGFAHLTLPSSIVAGLVDVPGHERFIHNMLAGAAEMDIVLLVVSADEGVMPQTMEHLEILQLLHAKQGLTVITKCDLVSKDWLELIKADVLEHLKGSFLENAPLVAVSSVTGEGLDELVSLMDNIAQQVPPKDTDRSFRLYIDDAFVKAGFGTVVRGAIFSGQVNINDEVEVVPKGIVTKVRSLHAYGKGVEVAVAGQRAAMNLGGVERRYIERGDAVALPHTLLSTDRLDVQLRLLPSANRSVKDNAPVRFHLGTAERIGRIFFFERGELLPGEQCFAEIRLDRPIGCAWGDLFVIRSYSPMMTVGGGRVIDPHPIQPRRRYCPKTLSQVKLKSKDEQSFVQAILSERCEAVSITDIARRMFLPVERVYQFVNNLFASGLAWMLNKNFAIAIDVKENLQSDIVAYLKDYHQKHPFRLGVAKEHLRTAVAHKMQPSLFDEFLAYLSEVRVIVIDRMLIRLIDHEVKLNEEVQGLVKTIENQTKASGFSPPEWDELLANFPDREQVGDLLNLMVEQGRLVKVAEFIVHPNIIEQAKIVAKKLCERQGSFTPAQFRDEVGTTRKYVMPLLEFLDHIGFTVRQGDKRTLKKKN